MYTHAARWGANRRRYTRESQLYSLLVIKSEEKDGHGEMWARIAPMRARKAKHQTIRASRWPYRLSNSLCAQCVFSGHFCQFLCNRLRHWAREEFVGPLHAGGIEREAKRAPYKHRTYGLTNSLQLIVSHITKRGQWATSCEDRCKEYEFCIFEEVKGIHDVIIHWHFPGNFWNCYQHAVFSRMRPHVTIRHECWVPCTRFQKGKHPPVESQRTRNGLQVS